MSTDDTTNGTDRARHPDAPQSMVEWARENRTFVEEMADGDSEAAWVFESLRQSLDDEEESS